MRFSLLLLAVALSLSPAFGSDASAPPSLGNLTWGESWKPGPHCTPITNAHDTWQDPQGTVVTTRAGRIIQLTAPGRLRFSDGVRIENGFGAAACLDRMKAHMGKVTDLVFSIQGEGECAAGRYFVDVMVPQGKVYQINIGLVPPEVGKPGRKATQP